MTRGFGGEGAEAENTMVISLMPDARRLASSVAESLWSPQYLHKPSLFLRSFSSSDKGSRLPAADISIGPACVPEAVEGVEVVVVQW